VAPGAAPWRLPDVDSLPLIDAGFATLPNTDDGGHEPYQRDPETLAREWAIPGSPGLMHRLGGIEKEDGTGNISYDPLNHEHMVHVRAAKVAGIARDLPPVEVEGDVDADVLVVGWGSTWGAIGAAVTTVRAEGHRVARTHITHLNPLPPGLGDVLRRYQRVLVPEMNLGQLTKVLRAEFLVDATCISKVQGQPFTGAELAARILSTLAELEDR
jgi:2-oxoglutarate ferredoxin oxidoreductase subunit alpha